MSPRQIINTIPDDHDQKEILRDFFLVESGSFTGMQVSSIPMPAKSEMRLYYIASGKGTANVLNKTHIVQQNDVAFQTHQLPVHWTASPELPMELWWIDLRGASLSALMRKLSVNDTSPVINGIYDPRFQREIKNVVTHYDALSTADILHITVVFSK